MSVYIDHRESSNKEFEFFDWGLSDDINTEVGDFESNCQDDENPVVLERIDVSPTQVILCSPDGFETRFSKVLYLSEYGLRMCGSGR